MNLIAHHNSYHRIDYSIVFNRVGIIVLVWIMGPVLAVAQQLDTSTLETHYEIDTSTVDWKTLTDSSRKNLLFHVVEFQGAGKDTTYYLNHTNIVVGSETVQAGSVLFHRGLEYSIDYTSGSLQFRIPIPVDIKLRVTYLHFPFGLKTIYRNRELFYKDVLDTGGQKSGRQLKVRRTGPADDKLETSEFTGSGSITRGFSIGSNQDFQLNSSLNVQMTGKVGDDVTIEASLTDENTPIQPEGNTQKLEEIDKVYIEIRKGQQLKAVFGDFNVQQSRSTFAKYNRKLQGITTEIRKPNFEGGFTLATTRGKFSTNTLVIQEGVQGPYQLFGASGEQDILVLAGTERVWVDGDALVRGETNDYVIDYSAGEITFTRKRLITSESRVVVDFEYSDEVFRRDFFATDFQANLFMSRLKLGGVLAREADDKSNPINLDLDPATIDSLSRLDDDTLQLGGNVAFVSGAQKTGVGQGRYVKRIDPAGTDSIFVFVGSDSIGNYNVRFTDFGFNRGDYERGNILGEFVFVGRNEGSFLPLVPLSLPTSTIVGALFGEWQPRKNITVNAELALSQFDLNTFSSSNLQGQALNLNTTISRQQISVGKRAFGEFDFTGRVRRLDSTFKEIDRLNHSEYNRTWNIRSNSGFATNQSSFGQEEQLIETNLAYRPVKTLQLETFYGDLQRGKDVLQSQRYGGGLKTLDEKYPLVNYRIELVNAEDKEQDHIESDVQRQSLNSSYAFWKVKPGFDYEDEVIESQTMDSSFGTSYFTYRPRIEIIKLKYISLGALYEHRTDKRQNSRVDSLAGIVSVSTTQSYNWRLQNWENLTAVIAYTRRKKEFKGHFKTGQNLDKLTNLVSSNIDYTPWRRALNVNIQYQAADERVQNRKIQFIQVQPNTGNFVQAAPDSFVQVLQGEGDWIQGVIRSGAFTPIVELRAGLRVRFEPARLLSTSTSRPRRSRQSDPVQRESIWTRILRNLSTDSFLRLEESQQDPGFSFYTLNLSKYQDKDRTIRGNFLFRQDVHGFLTSRDVLLRVRFELQKNLSSLLTDGFEQRRRELHSVRTKYRFAPKWAFESDASVESHSRTSTIAAGSLGNNFDIRTFTGEPALSYFPNASVEIKNKLKLSTAKDQVSMTRVSTFGWLPELIYSWRQKGRAVTSLELTRLTQSRESAVLPFELSQGNRRGINARWRFTAQYRISNHINASLNYQGRKEPNQPAVHLGSAEFRAFF